VLTESDILSAPSHAPSADLERMVGGRQPPHAPMPMGRAAPSSRGSRSSMGAYM
jgi:hypothetical protein